MTKVKLTEAQNKALASYLFHYGANMAIEQSMHVDSFTAPYASLNKLSYLTIGQAVQYGWDVIPAIEFNVGDIVVTPMGNVVRLIADIGGGEFRGTLLYSDRLPIGVNGRIDIRMDGLRKATKDEVFFAKLGRKVKDFHNGDGYVDGNGIQWEIGEPGGPSIADALRWFNRGDDFMGLVPAGAMVKYEEIEGGAK